MRSLKLNGQRNLSSMLVIFGQRGVLVEAGTKRIWKIAHTARCLMRNVNRMAGVLFSVQY